MIYVRDGELRVVNDAKGQNGYRVHEPDGHIRAPFHRLSPYARGKMFPEARNQRPHPADSRIRFEADTAKSVRRVVGRSAWHRWNVLKARIPETVAREQARFFIHRARLRRAIAESPTGDSK